MLYKLPLHFITPRNLTPGIRSITHAPGDVPTSRPPFVSTVRHEPKIQSWMAAKPALIVPTSWNSTSKTRSTGKVSHQGATIYAVL